MDTPQQPDESEKQPLAESESDSDEDSETERFTAKVSVHPMKVSLVKQIQKQGKHGEDREELEALIDPSHQSVQELASGEIQSKNPDPGEAISRTGEKNEPERPEVSGTGGAKPKYPKQLHSVTGEGLQITGDPVHLENRDIFETGGEQFADPSLGLNRQASESAEAFPASATGSEEDDGLAALPRCCPVAFCLKSFWRRVKVWWGISTCRNQLLETPFQFVASVIAVLFCVMLANRLDADQKDIPICILVVIVFCWANTLTCRRYCCLDRGPNLVDTQGDQEELVGGQDCGICFRNVGCDCSLCCFGDLGAIAMPTSSRSSRHLYKRRRGNNSGSNTAFVHEVVDVSKLDPLQCPQIKHVDSETIYESISQDSSNSPIGKADAVVHLSETGTRSEEASSILERHGQDVACPTQSQAGESQIEGLFPKCPTNEVPKPQIGPRLSELSVQDIPELEVREAAEADGVFMCEHFGQAVACGCFELAQKELVQAQYAASPSRNGDIFLCEHCGQDIACVCPSH